MTHPSQVPRPPNVDTSPPLPQRRPPGPARGARGARYVALAGAAVATIVLLVGGGAIVLAQDTSRRALIDIGLAPSLRAGIVARWAAVPVHSLALAAILTPVVALAGPAASLDALSWSSTIAYTLGSLTALALARAYLQPPRPSIE